MKRWIGLAAAALLTGCAPVQETTMRPIEAPPVHTWAYYVDGSASSANITYSTASGTSQASISLPLMTKSGKRGIQMVGDDAPHFLYISAQNADDYGGLTCQITKDGIVIAQNSADGAFTIATCQASR